MNLRHIPFIKNFIILGDFYREENKLEMQLRQNNKSVPKNHAYDDDIQANWRQLCQERQQLFDQNWQSLKQNNLEKTLVTRSWLLLENITTMLHHYFNPTAARAHEWVQAINKPTGSFE